MTDATAQKYHLNAICPYFTMFRIEFPYDLLRQHGTNDDIVLDPFCGRGTTNFACRLLGIQSYGIDSNPVATAISSAKLVSVKPELVVETARRILEGTEPKEVPVGDFWALAFDPDVLRSICTLREALIADSSTAERLALRALMLGALHGPRTKSAPWYFSNQSQRTYAPKPAYAVRYWRTHSLIPPSVDVLDLVGRRATRYYQDAPTTNAAGQIIRGDSRNLATYQSVSRHITWVITSPPYWGMHTYRSDQWLRLWFVGGDAAVDYSSEHQLGVGNQQQFVQGLREAWRNAATVCEPGARMVIRIGAIGSREADPVALAHESLVDTPWIPQAVVSAGFADGGHRQAKHILRGEIDRAKEEFDIWATLD